MKKLSRESLNNILNLHDEWHKSSGKNGSQANLSSLDLSDISLFSRNLSEANISNSKLIGCDARWANLARANFSNCDLSLSDLSGAILHEAILLNANLTQAKLMHCHLQLANLTNTNFENANLVESNLRGCVLTEANLSASNLKKADIAYANLDRANLNKANLQGVNLHHASLHMASLHGTNLYNANLSNAILSKADLRHADLGGANLASANLSDSILLGASLIDVKLDETYAAHALLPEKHIKHIAINTYGYLKGKKSRRDISHLQTSYRIHLWTRNLWSPLELGDFLYFFSNIYIVNFAASDEKKNLRFSNEKREILRHILSAARIYNLNENLLPSEDFLIIERVSMSSPGEIRIEGGSIIREMRELIKDLSYRNEHQKEMGQLEIIEKKISILKDLGLSEREIAKIVDYLNENIYRLDELISKGKIGIVLDERA